MKTVAKGGYKKIKKVDKGSYKKIKKVDKERIPSQSQAISEVLIHVRNPHAVKEPVNLLALVEIVVDFNLSA